MVVHGTGELPHVLVIPIIVFVVRFEEMLTKRRQEHEKRTGPVSDDTGNQESETTTDSTPKTDTAPPLQPVASVKPTGNATQLPANEKERKGSFGSRLLSRFRTRRKATPPPQKQQPTGSVARCVGRV